MTTIMSCFTEGTIAAPLLAAETLVAFTARAALVVLVIALGIAFLRVVKGPTMPDRVIALDLIATLLVGVIAVSSVETGDVIFLRVAMVVALFNFIGTIGFSWYLQRGQSK